MPNRVAADKAYQNAKQNSDKQNARIEHDKGLAGVMTVLKTTPISTHVPSSTIRHRLSATLAPATARA